MVSVLSGISTKMHDGLGILRYDGTGLMADHPAVTGSRDVWSEVRDWKRDLDVAREEPLYILGQKTRYAEHSRWRHRPSKEGENTSLLFSLVQLSCCVLLTCRDGLSTTMLIYC